MSEGKNEDHPGCSGCLLTMAMIVIMTVAGSLVIDSIKLFVLRVEQLEQRIEALEKRPTEPVMP